MKNLLPVAASAVMCNYVVMSTRNWFGPAAGKISSANRREYIVVQKNNGPPRHCPWQFNFDCDRSEKRPAVGISNFVSFRVFFRFHSKPVTIYSCFLSCCLLSFINFRIFLLLIITMPLKLSHLFCFGRASIFFLLSSEHNAETSTGITAAATVRACALLWFVFKLRICQFHVQNHQW